jgi:hypothetical protein
MYSFSRRAALKSSVAGFGYLAFAGLSTWAAEKNNPLAPKKTHFPAKAKRVIFLCMEGAPSHVDTFDYKPKLPEFNGRSMPRARTFARVLASPWKFSQHGQSGLWISEVFPEVAAHAGFVTISPPLQNGGPANYGSAFLPAVYQGTPIRTGFGGFGGFARPGAPGGGASVSNIRNPRQSVDAQRAQLDFIGPSNHSNWPSACRRTCPESWTSRTRALRPGPCMASANRRPRASAGSASWHGASSRPGCGLSSSLQASGTITAI